MDDRSLEQEDEEKGQGGWDGEDADELLRQDHAAEAGQGLGPAVNQVDDSPEEIHIQQNQDLFQLPSALYQQIIKSKPIANHQLENSSNLGSLQAFSLTFVTGRGGFRHQPKKSNIKLF